jgi:hypothetical protein
LNHKLKTAIFLLFALLTVNAKNTAIFKNNGFSEIFAFSYDVYCTPPLQIATDGVSQDQAKVTWTGALENFDYQVKYREKNADSQWYTAVTPREFAKLVNLKPNTTYEYTVGAACEKGKYVHSSLQEFTTLAKDEIAFTGCGIKPSCAKCSCSANVSDFAFFFKVLENCKHVKSLPTFSVNIIIITYVSNHYKSSINAVNPRPR